MLEYTTYLFGMKVSWFWINTKYQNNISDFLKYEVYFDCDANIFLFACPHVPIFYCKNISLFSQKHLLILTIASYHLCQTFFVISCVLLRVLKDFGVISSKECTAQQQIVMGSWYYSRLFYGSDSGWLTHTKPPHPLFLCSLPFMPFTILYYLSWGILIKNVHASKSFVHLNIFHLFIILAWVQVFRTFLTEIPLWKCTSASSASMVTCAETEVWNLGGQKIPCLSFHPAIEDCLWHLGAGSKVWGWS